MIANQPNIAELIVNHYKRFSHVPGYSNKELVVLRGTDTTGIRHAKRKSLAKPASMEYVERRKINSIYKLSRILTNVTNTEYSIDHIIPLRYNVHLEYTQSGEFN